MELLWAVVTVSLLQLTPTSYSVEVPSAELELIGNLAVKSHLSQLAYDPNVEDAQKPEFHEEMLAGDIADLEGTNVHHSYPAEFKDLGRRFVLQYPYTEKKPINDADSKVPTKIGHKKHDLIPVKANPEIVLEMAMNSALNQARQPDNDVAESVHKEILRTGDYWNSIWVENVDPSVLRTNQNKQLRTNLPKLGSVKAKIMPGSKLYHLVSVLKQYSPRLLYVINSKN